MPENPDELKPENDLSEPKNEGMEPGNSGVPESVNGVDGTCEIQSDYELVHIISGLITDGLEMLRVLNRHIHAYRYSIVWFYLRLISCIYLVYILMIIHACIYYNICIVICSNSIS